MLAWFVATAVLATWYVFRDPTFDYRLLIVGSLIPSVVDLIAGGARMLHSVVFSVVLLGVIMVATTGRRPLRRTLLGLPLGTLLHLVFSAAWVDTELFWWPVSGLRFDDSSSLFVDRGLLNVPLEVIGLILLWWIYRAADLADPAIRSDFASTGRLTLGVN